MSVASMTGFARAQGACGDYSFVFELKSVNGRGLDLRFRLPSPFDALEQDLRARAQKRLARGNVQINLAVKREVAASAVRVNQTLFLELAELTEQLGWKANLAAATVGDLLRLPGVIETSERADEPPSAELFAAIAATFEAALAQLIASRNGEGEALHRIIAGQLDQMQSGIEAAAAADALRPAAIRARLRAQVQSLMDGDHDFDPERLHQEAVLIATRVDVREEIDRFTAHVAAARQLMAAREPVGRKLDFLTQEFVREANTLCSKANDIALTRIGLDLKALVEQFREQVQNIE